MADHDTSHNGLLADVLNRDCHCIAVNRVALHDSLEAHLRESGIPEQWLDTHSRLFADSPVFIAREHLHTMQQLIAAVERVTENPHYREAVLPAYPDSAGRELGPRGVFYSYDFHLAEDGPRLIEINTNAGGVLLNLYLAAAQQACCIEVDTFFGGTAGVDAAEEQLITMFREEWQLQKPQQTLHTIALVDEQPAAQFLYPELLLFQALFQRHGFAAIIADPQEFTLGGDGLYLGERKIDLVYNRLTDFYLEQTAAANLLQAYQQGLVVLSPSPRHYALHADKRNLPVLSNARQLRDFGVDEEAIGALQQSLPHTVLVTRENAEQLWQQRKQLFFKPATGYGSRGAYRGAKLTKRVWQEIMHADYIAQAIVPPSERQLIIDGNKQSLKLDLRCVTYHGAIQQLSARLYQGQTTNLRTAGGGLATVFATPV